MENLKVKVKVKNEVESKEVQELFFELGCEWRVIGVEFIDTLDVIICEGGFLTHCSTEYHIDCGENHKELTIQQLKDMVVLKRNDVGDATHACDTFHKRKGYLTSDGVEYIWNYGDGYWCIYDNDRNFKSLNLKPIEKKEMKEFLVKHDDKWTLQLLDSDTEENSYRVAVPSGAKMLIKHPNCREVWSYSNSKVNPLNTILWQRSETEYLMQCVNGDKLTESISQLKNQDTVKVTIDELKHRVGVDATLAERQATYGSFEDVAFVTENVMGVLSKARPNGLSDLPNTHRMALYMIASKMARIVNGDFNHLDSWHDIGGYAKLIENLIGDEDE